MTGAVGLPKPGDLLQGRRLPDELAKDIISSALEVGDYLKALGRADNEWWFRDPSGRVGRITKHEVVQHDDGTITVSPSILHTGHDGGWHGYLERGIWRTV